MLVLTGSMVGTLVDKEALNLWQRSGGVQYPKIPGMRSLVDGYVYIYIYTKKQLRHIVLPEDMPVGLSGLPLPINLRL